MTLFNLLTQRPVLVIVFIIAQPNLTVGASLKALFDDTAANFAPSRLVTTETWLNKMVLLQRKDVASLGQLARSVNDSFSYWQTTLS